MTGPALPGELTTELASGLLIGRAGLLRHAVWREHLGGERLHSFTRPGNRRSRAVMERLGMTLRGSTRWRGFIHVWYALDPGG